MIIIAGSIDFMDVWQRDEQISVKPSFTAGMCPNRPVTGPDGAWAVTSSYATYMSEIVTGIVIFPIQMTFLPIFSAWHTILNNAVI